MMLKRMVLSLVLAATATSVSWALFEKGEEKHESAESAKMQLDQAPAAVQAAIKKAAGSAKVAKVEKETEDGRTCYEAGWKVGDVDHEVVVSDAGHVMETEMSVIADAVPKAVRLAARKRLPKGANAQFELKTVTLYEVAAMVDCLATIGFPRSAIGSQNTPMPAFQMSCRSNAQLSCYGADCGT